MGGEDYGTYDTNGKISSSNDPLPQGDPFSGLIDNNGSSIRMVRVFGFPIPAVSHPTLDEVDVTRHRHGRASRTHRRAKRIVHTHPSMFPDDESLVRYGSNIDNTSVLNRSPVVVDDPDRVRRRTEYFTRINPRYDPTERMLGGNPQYARVPNADPDNAYAEQVRFNRRVVQGRHLGRNRYEAEGAVHERQYFGPANPGGGVGRGEDDPELDPFADDPGLPEWHPHEHYDPWRPHPHTPWSRRFRRLIPIGAILAGHAYFGGPYGDVENKGKEKEPDYPMQKKQKEKETTPFAKGNPWYKSDFLTNFVHQDSSGGDFYKHPHGRTNLPFRSITTELVMSRVVDSQIFKSKDDKDGWIYEGHDPIIRYITPPLQGELIK